MAKRNPTSSESGMTLLELLVVLVILGLIGGIVAVSVFDVLGDSKPKVARLQIDNLSQTLDIYRLSIGNYPEEEQGLNALVAAPNGVVGWSGPYINKTSVPLDPWGNAYIYRRDGSRFEIVSLGADGTAGGEGENADISSRD